MPPQSEWEPKFCAPGRPIYINHPDNTLVETRPKNAQYYRRTIVWSTIHEYSHSYRRLGHHQWIQRKNKEIILKFIRQEFPFLCTLVNKHRKPCHNYGPFQFYGKTRYGWYHIIYKTLPLGIYKKQVLTKNKHKLLHMLKAYTSHITYLQIINSVFPWLHISWTWFPVITVILYYYTHNARSQDVSIFLLFWFMICTLHAFITDTFSWNLTYVHIYLYNINNYCHTRKDRVMLDDRIRDSSCEIPSISFQNIFLGKFPVFI